MILRHSATYFSARAASGAVNLLTIAVFTRLLSPAEYGRYALTVAAVGFVSNTLFGWLGHGLVRYLTAEEREPRQTTTAVLTAWGALNLALSTIAYSIALLVFPEWQALVLAGIAMLWAQTWYDLCLETHRSSLKPSRYALMLLLRSGLALLLGVFLIRQGWGVLGALAGATGGLILSGIAVKPDALRFDARAFRRKTVAELFRYGLPLSLNSVFLMVVHFSDRFLIAAFLGEAAAGVYAAAYDIAQQSVALVMRSVGNAVPPLVFRAYEQGNHAATYRYLARNFQILSAVGALVVTLLWGASAPLSAVIVGAAFREQATQIIPVVAFAAFVIGLRTHHFMLPMLLLRTTYGVVVPSVVAAAVNVGMNLWWIPAFGIQGAAWATLVAYTVTLLMVIRAGKDLLPMPFPWLDVVKISTGAGWAWLVISQIGVPDDWRGLVIKAAAGVCAYLLALGILYRREVRESLSAFRRGS